MNFKKQAFSLYSPPFEFIRGYIFDANGHMVADEAGANIALRIRGWGRISYMENPAEIQDTAGHLVAEALTEYWNNHSES